MLVTRIRDGTEVQIAEEVDFVLLDCMGYSLKHKKLVESITNKTVLLHREMIFAHAEGLS